MEYMCQVNKYILVDVWLSEVPTRKHNDNNTRQNKRDKPSQLVHYNLQT